MINPLFQKLVVVQVDFLLQLAKPQSIGKPLGKVGFQDSQVFD